MTSLYGHNWIVLIGVAVQYKMFMLVSWFARSGPAIGSLFVRGKR